MRGTARAGNGGDDDAVRMDAAHSPAQEEGGEPASATVGTIAASFRALSAECAELLSARPGARRGGLRRARPASPGEGELLVSLGRQRAAFSLSATVSLGCPLTSLAHPETVRALLADQRDADAGALRRLQRGALST